MRILKGAAAALITVLAASSFAGAAEARDGHGHGGWHGGGHHHHGGWRGGGFGIGFYPSYGYAGGYYDDEYYYAPRYRYRSYYRLRHHRHHRRHWR
jgi:hypothetical protein